MNRYQHQKGKINDNALEALLHDPLFRQRIEKNQKGKGSYQRKEKHAKGRNWEASDKQKSLSLAFTLKLKKPPYSGGFFIIIYRDFVVLKGHEFQSAVTLHSLV